MPAVDAEPVFGIDPMISPPDAPLGPAAGARAVRVLWSFGKCLGALLPVYLAGYYGISIAVVLLGLIVYMGWKHSRLDKTMRFKSAMYIQENEKEFITRSVFRARRDLPPWVRTPFSATSGRLNFCCTSATSHQCYRLIVTACYCVCGGRLQFVSTVNREICFTGDKYVYFPNCSDYFLFPGPD